MKLRNILNKRSQDGEIIVAGDTMPSKSSYSGSESVASAKAREREAAINFRSIASRRSSNDGAASYTSTTEMSHFTSSHDPVAAMATSPNTEGRRESSYYTGGRDFYDDGYDSSHASLEDRLDFSDLKLTGRDKELQTLHDVYSHVNRKGVTAEKPIDLKLETSVAIIQGLSGTGKSTLVKQFVEDLNKKSVVTGGPTKPYFLSGKYDELSGGDPFSAIVEAFSGFTQSLLLDLENQGESAESEVKRIRTAIRASLGDEAHVMATMVPSLRDLIVSEDDDASPAAAASAEHAWNRLRYIFQVFSNAISTAERPVILFLDDLQWSDSASLELLEALLTDKDLRYFMFVGAYRSNEVETGGELLTRLEAISKVQGIKEIELSNLSVGELNEFIADALKIEEDRERALSLTEVIHNKCSGNIFFAVQLMEELQRKGVLMFSRMTFEWEWNLEGADTIDSLVSDDVIAAVTSKIMSTPDLLQKALISMAYSRSTVDMDTIRRLLEMDGYLIKAGKLEKLLEKAVFDGLLTNRVGSDSYSFAHDRIQQAAHEMIPAGRERDVYRLKMGLRLHSIASAEPSGSDWLLFSAADHLNATSKLLETQKKDPMFLTKINMEAGTRAASIAAFETASKFLGLALGCLLQHVKSPWDVEYDMTLNLYQGIANAEFCQGHFEIGRGIATRVLEHAKMPEDKLGTQISLCKALGRQNKRGEAYELSGAAIRDLGVVPKRFFKSVLTLIKDMSYAKKCFKKMSDEEILSLPVVTDKRLISITNLLSAFSLQGFYTNHKIYGTMATMKLIRLTFQHGLFPSSVGAIMNFCLISQQLNDKEGVERFAGLAAGVLEKIKLKEIEVMQMFLAGYYIHSWRDSHEVVFAVYERGEKAGMEAGDFENGTLCAMVSNFTKVIWGFHLPELEWKYAAIIEKMDQYNVPFMRRICEQQQGFVRNMMGVSKSLPDFKELSNFKVNNADGTENYVLMHGCLRRIQLGVYFGEYKLAEKMIDMASPVWEMDESYIVASLRLFFCSLVYATLARHNQDSRLVKKSYLKKARACSKTLKAQCKLKGMSCYHRHLLAEAQIAAAGGSGTSIPKRYNEAIAAALESGNKHDAALGAQLAAEYFLTMSDESLISAPLREARNKLVRENLTQARDLYLRWGAKAVVMHLETQFKQYISPTVDLFDDELSTTADSNAVTFKSTFKSMVDEADYAVGSVVLPKSITPSLDGSVKDDDVSVLTGLTGVTGFTGMTSRAGPSDRSKALNPHTDVTGFSPINEDDDDGFCPLEDTGWQ